MKIGSGKCTYEWIGDWTNFPDSESARTGWAHHGIVVTEAGNVIAFHPGDPTVVVFDRDGNLLHSWSASLTEGHGITLVKEANSEFLWIADNGSKRQKKLNYEYPPGSEKVSGQVVKMTLGGQTVTRVQKPPLSIYRNTRFAPTSVAVNEERFGGNGDVWVADGYGANYVHRYDKNCNYITSINGEEGKAGAYKTPHAIFIDRRRSQPELYVADRTNRRVQVYDLEGNFKRVFGSDFLVSPSGFVTDRDLLIIAELHARLAVLDINDRLVCYLGENKEVCQLEGWPNSKNEKGQIVPTKLLEPSKFNSPHGIAVDREGNLYVAEWLIGGRITKLAST